MLCAPIFHSYNVTVLYWNKSKIITVSNRVSVLPTPSVKDQTKSTWDDGTRCRSTRSDCCWVSAVRRPKHDENSCLWSLVCRCQTCPEIATSPLCCWRRICWTVAQADCCPWISAPASEQKITLSINMIRV